MAELTPFEAAARRKTKANCRLRHLSDLLAQAQAEFDAASAELAALKPSKAAQS